MKSVFDIIVQLRATASKNEKLAILFANKDNDALKTFLKLVYEPKLSYYMTKIAKVAQSAEFMFDIEHIEELFLQLNARQLSGNAAKNHIGSIYLGCNEWQKDLLQCLVDRDVKAGFNVGSINKTWNNLVTEIPYMRCSLLKDTKLSQWLFKNGMFSQIKADGMFSNMNNYPNANLESLTRAGNSLPYEYISHLQADFDQLSKDYQYHGECLVLDNNTNTVLSRKKGNGILNSALQDGNFDSNAYTVIYKVWDMVPLSEATVRNKYKKSYRERFTELQTIVSKSNLKYVSLAENRVVYSIEEAIAHFREAVLRGEEGTILKEPDLLIWEDTTSKYQVKFKIQAQCDLKIKGFEFDGKGKNKDLFKSLICHSEDGLVIANVSGFSDKFRKELMEKGDQLIGTVVTVNFNDIVTSESKSTYSLFLPTFEELRLDKKTADDYATIYTIFEDAKLCKNLKV